MLMRGIKIPLHDFALKMQGGLMREGGHIWGTLRYLQEHKYPMIDYQYLSACNRSMGRVSTKRRQQSLTVAVPSAAASAAAAV